MSEECAESIAIDEQLPSEKVHGAGGVPPCCPDIGVLGEIIVVGVLLVVAANAWNVPRGLRMVLNVMGAACLHAFFVLFWQLYQCLITPYHSIREEAAGRPAPVERE
jgi:hypothetical protein